VKRTGVAAAAAGSGRVQGRAGGRPFAARSRPARVALLRSRPASAGPLWFVYAFNEERAIVPCRPPGNPPLVLMRGSSARRRAATVVIDAGMSCWLSRVGRSETRVSASRVNERAVAGDPRSVSTIILFIFPLRLAAM